MGSTSSLLQKLSAKKGTDGAKKSLVDRYIKKREEMKGKNSKKKNPYNCDNANSGECDVYPDCKCQWFL